MLDIARRVAVAMCVACIAGCSAASTSPAGHDASASATSGQVASGKLRTPIELLPVTAGRPAGPGGCPAGWTGTADRQTCYRLGPGITVRQVTNIGAISRPDLGGWEIAMSLVPSDSAGFARLAAQAYQHYQRDPTAPQGRIAILVTRDQVLSAPAVSGPITNGQLEISGPPSLFTRQYVETVVRSVSGG